MSNRYDEIIERLIEQGLQVQEKIIENYHWVEGYDGKAWKKGTKYILINYVENYQYWSVEYGDFDQWLDYGTTMLQLPKGSRSLNDIKELDEIVKSWFDIRYQQQSLFD